MLDSSALIGLHEAARAVAARLAAVLEQLDDGTVPKTHQVVLGELWTGVLAAGQTTDRLNPRRAVLDSAAGLDVETIDDRDAPTFARITNATNRAMSHNDRWICAAAIRTRSNLITQDADMADQLGRYFASLDLVDGLQHTIGVICVPRDPEQLVGTVATTAVPTIRITDEIRQLLARLDPLEAQVVTLRAGLDRGDGRSLQQVAHLLGLKTARVDQIEQRAFDRLRSTPR